MFLDPRCQKDLPIAMPHIKLGLEPVTFNCFEFVLGLGLRKMLYYSVMVYIGLRYTVILHRLTLVLDLYEALMPVTQLDFDTRDHVLELRQRAAAEIVADQQNNFKV